MEWWLSKVSFYLLWIASFLLPSKFSYCYFNLCKRKCSHPCFYFLCIASQKENRECNQGFIFDSPWSLSAFSLFVVLHVNFLLLYFFSISLGALQGDASINLILESFDKHVKGLHSVLMTRERIVYLICWKIPVWYQP